MSRIAKIISIIIYFSVIIFNFWACSPYFGGLYGKLLYAIILDVSLLLFIISGLILLFSPNFPHVIWLPIIFCAITPLTTLYIFYSFASQLAYYIPTAMVSCFIIACLNKKGMSKRRLLYIVILMSVVILLEPYILPALPE